MGSFSSRSRARGVSAAARAAARAVRSALVRPAPSTARMSYPVPAKTYAPSAYAQRSASSGASASAAGSLACLHRHSLPAQIEHADDAPPVRRGAHERRHLLRRVGLQPYEIPFRERRLRRPQRAELRQHSTAAALLSGGEDRHAVQRERERHRHGIPMRGPAQEAAALRTVLAHQPPQALEFNNRLMRLQHVVQRGVPRRREVGVESAALVAEPRPLGHEHETGFHAFDSLTRQLPRFERQAVGTRHHPAVGRRADPARHEVRDDEKPVLAGRFGTDAGCQRLQPGGVRGGGERRHLRRCRRRLLHPHDGHTARREGGHVRRARRRDLRDNTFFQPHRNVSSRQRQRRARGRNHEFFHDYHRITRRPNNLRICA